MKRPVQPTMSTMQKKIDVFNSLIKVGETVNVKLDSGEVIQDTIRYPASIMGGHTPVAWLVNKGSYVLERVTKI
jgi:hypothetical protein